jgi:hypothetical protein
MSTKQRGTPRAEFMEGVEFDLTNPEGAAQAVEEAKRRGLIRAGDEVVAVACGTEVVTKAAPKPPLTRGEVLAVAQRAVVRNVDAMRAAPWDPSDVFDRGGAVAVADGEHVAFGRWPRDDVADIIARELAHATHLDRTLSRGVKAAGRPTGDDEWMAGIRDSVTRTAWAFHTVGAWMRDGLPTYDLTAGLYARLRDCLADPGVADAPFAEVVFPRPAFALRFPGPDYPVIADPHGRMQIRGLIVYQLADAATDEGLTQVRQVMSDTLSVAEIVGDNEENMTCNADLTSALSDAGFAALTNVGRSVNVIVAGWALDEKRACGSCIENTTILLRPASVQHVTVREAIEWAVEKAKTLTSDANAVALTEALTVAFGAGLYLANVPDEGMPVRSKPIRRKGAEPITPEVRVLGRGVTP